MSFRPRKRPGRRTLLVLLLLLAGGAIINVAVAWGCALRSHIRWRSERVLTKDDLAWLDRHQVQAAEKSMTISQGIGYRYEGVDLQDYHISTAALGKLARAWKSAHLSVGPHITVPSEAERDFAGFPFYSFGCEVWFLPLDRFANISSKPPTLEEHVLMDGARFVSGDWTKHGFDDVPYPLPIAPLWPGFAINTIFYAAILWIALTAPFKLRRWRRIKRGCCIKCNYDLRGTAHERCPECGSPL